MTTAALDAPARPAVTSTVGALSDRELLRATSTLVRHERHLQGAVIDHLAEIDARRLYLQRGCSSLFDYATAGSICKYCDDLSVTPISRYCFRNPLVVLDSLRSIAEPRAEPVIVTVDGIDRGTATAASMSLTFWHATWDTVKTAGRSVPT